MPKPVLTVVATTLTFLAMDATWITLTGDKLYRPALGPIMSDSFQPIPAVLFYVIYLFTVIVLVVRPAIEAGRLGKAVMTGALFGFAAYATYDLTNQATLKVWSTTVTLCDLAWGTFVTATASSVGFLVGRRKAA